MEGQARFLKAYHKEESFWNSLKCCKEKKEAKDGQFENLIVREAVHPEIILWENLGFKLK
jgi:hypothetical protein